VRTGFLIISGDEAPLLEHSLAAAVSEGFDEGLVVDNGSTDSTADVAARCGVPRLALAHRRPYIVAMNEGLSRLGADAIACLHADTFIVPGYREACLQALAGPQVGSVAPKLLRASGARPEDRLPVIDAASITLDRRRKNSLVGHGAPARAFSTPAETFGADGAAAMYRRETLEDCAVEGQFFDLGMPGHYASDVDLAWRAQMLGWRSWYQPAALAYHIRTYSPTTRPRMSGLARRTQFRNRYLMMIKNDSLTELAPDAGQLLLYEPLALGFAVLREPELLPGYLETARHLPAALRWRRVIQARRRVPRVPFGLCPAD
jgi:GT2 family glycosyltransferase